MDIDIPPSVPVEEAKVLIDSTNIRHLLSDELTSTGSSKSPNEISQLAPTRTRIDRSRSHIINTLLCLIFVSTSLFAMSTGLTGASHSLEHKILDIQVDINLVQSRNRAERIVKAKADALTQNYLPLRIFENHTECLVRSINTAYSYFLPHDFTEYPDVREQTTAWAEDSCAKLFNPQSRQPQFLTAAWQVCRQEVGDLVQFMKHRLGRARHWILEKWGDDITPRSTPRILNVHNEKRVRLYDRYAHDARRIPILTNFINTMNRTAVLSPSIRLASCETARCHLAYVPQLQHFPPTSDISHETRKQSMHLLENLQKLHRSLSGTAVILGKVYIMLLFIQVCLVACLCIKYRLKNTQQQNQTSSPVFSWRQAWRDLSSPENRRYLVFSLPCISLASHIMSNDYIPLTICLGMLTIGCTALMACIYTKDFEVPNISQLLVELKALVNLKRKDSITSQGTATDQVQQQVPEPSPAVVQPANTVQPEQKSLLQDVCSRPVVDKAIEEAPYEDVDLYSSDSDADSEHGSEWSVVDKPTGK